MQSNIGRPGGANTDVPAGMVYKFPATRSHSDTPLRAGGGGSTRRSRQKAGHGAEFCPPAPRGTGTVKNTRNPSQPDQRNVHLPSRQTLSPAYRLAHRYTDYELPEYHYTGIPRDRSSRFPNTRENETAKSRRKTDGGPIKWLALSKINAWRPAGDGICRVFKDATLRMDPPPGCPISEAVIGARLGAGRTPVREAMMLLREAQLVSTYPSRASITTKLNREKALEAQCIREALELAIIRRLAETGMPASVQRDRQNRRIAKTSA